MFSNKLIQVALAVGVGISTGIYVFKPLLKEYEEETSGTWLRPGDETRVKELSEKRN
ncbi:uncharacterized protein BX663DRAFT_501071 [Cokeromyces recurvatus]|uniref:uncharacterized protein n=1 Tax=Cokeromyces recurvatus TaxID=90255 RepID=UPI00221EFE55|nr:uncharacterized protein BX663DRAFT_501071 [Cokeromyces recurvatus]KAI7904930.1 hypothetical protein BX663DRAFT_501071 [Cokeromyces recurvatus]